jgi:hypothetical protein
MKPNRKWCGRAGSIVEGGLLAVSTLFGVEPLRSIGSRHREVSLTPALWDKSVEAGRQCNEAGGDAADPDMVSFLGWEWSHANPIDPSIHYGQKNVVLRDTEAGSIPTRPIASRGGDPLPFILMGAIAPITASGFEPWSDFHRYALETP